MERFENDSTSSKDDREHGITNLTKITGIAIKTAEAMYEIGIHGYADLIDYLNQQTAEELSIALKKHGVNRPAGLIDKQTWIKEAETFSKSEKVIPAQQITESEPVGIKAKKPSIPMSRNHDVVFTVSFDVLRDDAGEPVLKTTVYDERYGGEEAFFKGTETFPWVNWIMERAKLPFVMEHVPSEIEEIMEPLDIDAETAQPPIPLELYEVLFEIVDVKLSVIEPTLELPEKRLEAELTINMSGPDAESLTLQDNSFLTEIFTIDLDSGYPRRVASREYQFEPQIFEYISHLDFEVPVLGRFEFHSIIRLPPSTELKAYHRDLL
jgi:hypothetical protein